MRPEAYLYPSLRSFLLLDGDWFIQKDPKNRGIKEKWYNKEKVDVEKLTSVKVPACWQTYSEDLADYTGVVWYYKLFNWPYKKAKDSTTLIDFTAIDFRADVWLNGKKVGYHEGGYTRFCLDVTNYIEEGENLLVVRVLDPEQISKIPHGKQGPPWYARISGIWGSVYVEEIKSNIFLDNIYITANSSLDAISVSFELKTTKSNSFLTEIEGYEIKVEIISDKEVIATHRALLKDLKTDHNANSFFISEIAIPKPEIWSLENPKLYVCRLYLHHSPKSNYLDVVDVEFGLRKIEKRKGLLFLNNKPLLLKGVLDQAYHPLTLYNYPADKNGNVETFIKREISTLKELGFNLIRKHLKIEDPRYIYWCDHLGMLYWEEMPNFSKKSRYSKKIFDYELEKMIIRDRNHPSIVIWGIFNENWGIPYLWFKVNDRYVKRLFKLIKSLDPSRFVVDNSGWAHHPDTTELNDYHCYYLAPESAEYWTEMAEFLLNCPLTNFRGGKKEQCEDLPHILSEFGHAGLPNIRNLELSEALTYKNEPEYFRRGVSFPIIGSIKPKNWRKRYEKFTKIFFPRTLDHETIEKLDQWKSWLSNKYIVEELRKARSKNGKRWSGYVITQLCDLEWEYNGIMDYNREPKIFTDMLKELNKDTLVILRPTQRVYDTSENLEFEITVDNFSARSGEIEITIELIMEKDVISKKKLNVQLEPFTLTSMVQDINTSSIIRKLLKEGPKIAKLQATLSYKGKIINVNSEPIAFVSVKNKQLQVQEEIKIFSSWKKAKRYVEKGGKAILSLERKPLIIKSQKRKYWNYKSLLKTIKDIIFQRIKIKDLGLTIIPHHLGENWIGMFSLHLFFPSLLKQETLNLNDLWILKGLYPSYKIEIDENKISADTFIILSGIIQGWFNKFYATTIVVKYGKGTVIITTLPVRRKIKIAKFILQNLIEHLRNSSHF